MTSESITDSPRASPSRECVNLALCLMKFKFKKCLNIKYDLIGVGATGERVLGKFLEGTHLGSGKFFVYMVCSIGGWGSGGKFKLAPPPLTIDLDPWIHNKFQLMFQNKFIHQVKSIY